MSYSGESAALIDVHDQDRHLAARCASGDRSAQRQLFQQQRANVHAALYRILGSNRDMEDLVQEAFLQIFRSIGGFRGEARLSTWVARLSVRVAYHYLSRRKLSTVALEAVPDAPTNDPGAEKQYIAREAMRRLYGVLDRIDPKLRIAFTLHAIAGKPLREVAALTDVSTVAAKTRVWRARKEVARRAKKDPLLAAYLEQKEHAP